MVENELSKPRLFLWSLANTVITVILSSGIGFYFQQKNIKDEKLINYRMESLKNYTATIDRAVTLIDSIDSNLSSIKLEEIGSNRLIQDVQAAQRRVATIQMLNELGDLAFKLPYQMRVVLIVAKNHYGTLFWNKSVPEAERQKVKTENLTAKSFDIAFKIAMENFVIEGEPRHSELSDLLK